MNNDSLKNKQQGMTLIEIMVALLLGAFLLAGVMQIFLSSRQSYRIQDNLSRMQENGRFAMEFITRDIRMAGYQGCSITNANNNTSPQNPNPNPTPVTLTALNNNEIMGTNGVANNWNTIACGAGNNCVAGTDAISYHFGTVCGNLTGNMATNNANIQISTANSCGIQAYDVLLVADCSGADIFIASNASAAAGTQTIAHAANQNTSPMLSKVYGTDAQLFKLNSSTFFIRTGAGGRPALWKMNNTKVVSAANPVELVEGVENMQILYGEDTNADGTPDYYVAAGTAGLIMNQVISVRISLLVTSIDDSLTLQPRSYTYNGVLTTPIDRRLRRVFSSTISVRNR
ncbi:MAG: PilW family protein [Methylococcales bacterium]